VKRRRQPLYQAQTEKEQKNGDSNEKKAVDRWREMHGRSQRANQKSKKDKACQTACMKFKMEFPRMIEL